MASPAVDPLEQRGLTLSRRGLRPPGGSVTERDELSSPRRVRTDDGSWTYLHPLHGASYRSLRGARSESVHVFLNGSGLAAVEEGQWRVLELGFGTGLNFAVTAEAARRAGKRLYYEVFESDLFPPELWETSERWRALTPGEPQTVDSCTLHLRPCRWQQAEPYIQAAHAYYHDPFGPKESPDCWGEEVFRWALQALADNGVLATYGASTAARRAMHQAGLAVAVAPGWGGKREMTLAARKAEALGSVRPWRPR